MSIGKGLMFAAAGLTEGAGTGMEKIGATMREERLKNEDRAFTQGENQKNRDQANAVLSKTQAHETKQAEAAMKSQLDMLKMKLANEQSSMNTKQQHEIQMQIADIEGRLSVARENNDTTVEVAGMNIDSRENIARAANELSREITNLKIGADSANLQTRIAAEKESLQAKLDAAKENQNTKLAQDLEIALKQIASAEKQLSAKLAQSETESQRKFIGDVETGFNSSPKKAANATQAAEERGLLPKGPEAPPPAPQDPAARKQGQKYTAANGKIVEWDGKGWKVVK